MKTGEKTGEKIGRTGERIGETGTGITAGEATTGSRSRGASRTDSHRATDSRSGLSSRRRRTRTIHSHSNRQVRMGKSRSIVSILVMLVVSLASCTNRGVVYDEFVSIDKTTWDKDSLAVFRATVPDTTTAYDVELQVRNDNSYPYANLWLFVDVIDAAGHTRRDTVECILANPDGSWRGAGWGSLYTVRCPYMMNVRFQSDGACTFRLTHGMRTETLGGVTDIGLIISKHKTEER